MLFVGWDGLEQQRGTQLLGMRDDPDGTRDLALEPNLHFFA